MKKYEAFRYVRDEIRKTVNLEPNNGHTVGIYSVYDIETEVYNPPFTSDDLSALNVFVRAMVTNPELNIGLYKIGIFNTDTAVITDYSSISIEDCKICDSTTVLDIIEMNGGIEE